MAQWIMVNEESLRVAVFFGAFALMALWEVFSPRRSLFAQRGVRWANNLLLAFFNSLLLKFAVPVTASGAALFAAQQGWGWFNVFDAPEAVALIASLVILDFVIYFQHRIFHAIPWLWRLHRVHHADLDLDVTTGARFHPVEMALSLLIKSSVIVLIGAPVIAVIVFEIVLNGMAMFNHANVRLPASWDSLLRWLVVTPDVHRVHHSIEDEETNSNYGFCLSLWDRLFRSYRAQPIHGHDKMTIGLRRIRDPKDVIALHGLWLLPFRHGVRGFTPKRRRPRPGD